MPKLLEEVNAARVDLTKCARQKFQTNVSVTVKIVNMTGFNTLTVTVYSQDRLPLAQHRELESFTEAKDWINNL